jgi:hypothetical protein
VKFFSFEAEVAGGLGPNTVLDSLWPPTIHKLHYVFDGWLGDAVLESFPCFIVTEIAACALIQAGLTGFELGDVEISVSEQFRESYPGRRLPPFRWLKIVGKAGTDDFGYGSDRRLVVSENALASLRSVGVKEAILEPLENQES